MNDIPRRIRIDLATDTEKAIRDAIAAVERDVADVRMTDAVTLLDAALESVADVVDDVQPVTRRFWYPKPDAPTVEQAASPSSVEGQQETRMFPVMNDLLGAPSPIKITWAMAEKAYGQYSRRYPGQALERIAQRGGFYASELDEMMPTWRKEISEIETLKRQLTEQAAALQGMREQQHKLIETLTVEANRPMPSDAAFDVEVKEHAHGYRMGVGKALMLLKGLA